MNDCDLALIVCRALNACRQLFMIWHIFNLAKAHDTMKENNIIRLLNSELREAGILFWRDARERP